MQAPATSGSTTKHRGIWAGEGGLDQRKKKKIAVDLKKFKRLQENIQAWTHKREATIPAKFVR